MRETHVEELRERAERTAMAAQEAQAELAAAAKADLYRRIAKNTRALEGRSEASEIFEGKFDVADASGSGIANAFGRSLRRQLARQDERADQAEDRAEAATTAPPVVSSPANTTLDPRTTVPADAGLRDLVDENRALLKEVAELTGELETLKGKIIADQAELRKRLDQHATAHHTLLGRTCRLEFVTETVHKVHLPKFDNDDFQKYANRPFVVARLKPTKALKIEPEVQAQS